MASPLRRRALLQAGAALFGGAMLPLVAARAQQSGYEFLVKDIVYRRDGDKKFLARLYQPAGSGPQRASV